MLLTQEPTSFVFMVVTQEPTIRKFHMPLHKFHMLLHIFHMLLLLYRIPWKHFLLKEHHQSKLQFECQKFLRRSMHGCMRTCNKLSWGACWASEMSHLYPLFPSLFLTFHNPFNLPSYHFHNDTWVSPNYFPLYSFQYYK